MQSTTPAKVTSEGESKKISFDEALKNAVENLPFNPSAKPDMGETITVKEIAVKIDGITGTRKLIVKVEAE
jgi:hypothetical protein